MLEGVVIRNNYDRVKLLLRTLQIKIRLYRKLVLSLVYTGRYLATCYSWGKKKNPRNNNSLAAFCT